MKGVMRIDIVTLFPQMFEALTDYGVVGKAVQRGILSLHYWNPRDYADNKHNRVDDRPYGGGPGMLMQYPPLQKSVEAVKKQNPHALVIYLSPQGRLLNQAGLSELLETLRDEAGSNCVISDQSDCVNNSGASSITTSTSKGFKGLILVNGRYEGVDERFIESYVDQEWSIGDYVISGGELASMVMIDGLSRLLPGVLGHEDSAEQDSHSNGLLDCPHYTRPEIVDGKPVPSVLMSGDHKAIENWRMKQSIGRTYQRRPELLQKLNLTDEQQRLLDEYIQESKD